MRLLVVLLCGALILAAVCTETSARPSREGPDSINYERPLWAFRSENSPRDILTRIDDDDDDPGGIMIIGPNNPNVAGKPLTEFKPMESADEEASSEGIAIIGPVSPNKPGRPLENKEPRPTGAPPVQQPPVTNPGYPQFTPIKEPFPLFPPEASKQPQVSHEGTNKPLKPNESQVIVRPTPSDNIIMPEDPALNNPKPTPATPQYPVNQPSNPTPPNKLDPVDEWINDLQNHPESVRPLEPATPQAPKDEYQRPPPSRPQTPDEFSQPQYPANQPQNVPNPNRPVDFYPPQYPVNQPPSVPAPGPPVIPPPQYPVNQGPPIREPVPPTNQPGNNNQYPAMHVNPVGPNQPYYPPAQSPPQQPSYPSRPVAPGRPRYPPSQYPTTEIIEIPGGGFLQGQNVAHFDFPGYELIGPFEVSTGTKPPRYNRPPAPQQRPPFNPYPRPPYNPGYPVRQPYPMYPAPARPAPYPRPQPHSSFEIYTLDLGTGTSLQDAASKFMQKSQNMGIMPIIQQLAQG